MTPADLALVLLVWLTLTLALCGVVSLLDALCNLAARLLWALGDWLTR
jgi:hypothetical protein